ncbi:MAG: AccI family restriction endonuclease [Fibrobacter sp.]|jgi:type II restriction enzyme|nr:AccI family restriction endonuclease [Fibrobacter sp.]
MERYIDRINALIKKINPELLDLEKERDHGRPPSQVSSEFLTNKEQGDWAEKTLLDAINSNSSEYIAIQYGKSDDIIAGDEHFKEFYDAYQNELDSIGKRPDILIFDKKDLVGIDISSLTDEVVSKAKCGIEVRSSSFISQKYETVMEERYAHLVATVFENICLIKNEYADILNRKDSDLYKTVTSITEKNLHCASFTCRSWKSSKELVEVSNILKKIKQALKEIQTKRFHLSITPKVEDLKVVYNWVKKYNVPHYYVQVFFDRAYGISFERILELISNPENEDKKFFVEADVKNQNKTVIKIQSTLEKQLLDEVSIPHHFSAMRELSRGNLLFYVKFDRSEAVLKKDSFNSLFGIDL